MVEVTDYRERPSRLPGAVLWTRSGVGGARPVLPDGCMDLIWCDGTLLVAGPDTAAYLPAGGGHYAGIRFFPGAAPALLGVPAHELRDRRVDLADLFPAATVRALAGRVGESADRAAAVEAIALRRAARTDPPDRALTGVVRALAAGSSVAASADAVGIGARTLHRRALDAFGYGPKTLARILRLQRALAAAWAGTPAAEAAARTGYADQAHLARDMREFSGMTLGEWLGGQPSGA
ncbi:helix-turn-helix domain-containing protein [Nocardia puris]|uniref:AraC family transcriptional regulator n=1 Tax=Nocardia puris TaxID=208602 RepID=A0A366D0M7_9NOCA|nr:helix-turn-helix domain-containing protein [Nocardia puris]RBO83627.1 AraC family transcriptional regulator [Nocardia puris]